MNGLARAYGCEDCHAPAHADCDEACPSADERAHITREELDDAAEDEARMAWIDAGRPIRRRA
jgi:hypothetical protein